MANHKAGSQEKLYLEQVSDICYQAALGWTHEFTQKDLRWATGLHSTDTSNWLRKIFKRNEVTRRLVDKTYFYKWNNE